MSRYTHFEIPLSTGVLTLKKQVVSHRAVLRKRGGAGAPSLVELRAESRDVAKALAYAHRHDVVHRDIKEENVLLTDGAASVTDFGIAKAIRASRMHDVAGTITAAGTSLGTPAYMAPTFLQEGITVTASRRP